MPPRVRQHRPKLTPLCLRLLETLIAFKQDNDGNTPTIDVLADLTNTARSTVKYQLEILHDAGLITRVSPRHLYIRGALWIPPTLAERCQECSRITAVHLPPTA